VSRVTEGGLKGSIFLFCPPSKPFVLSMPVPNVNRFEGRRDDVGIARSLAANDFLC